MSSLVNKVKDAVSGDKHSHSAPEGTHGTHNSRVANAADPRIDSDRDHRAAPTNTLGGTGTHTGTHTGGNTYTHTQNTHTQGPASNTDGPHKSNLLNKADPRIDSDRDGSRNMGVNPHGTATTGTGSSTLGSHGTTGTHNTYGTTGGNVPEGTAGPHNSRVANAADPRVDSDLDSGRNRNVGGSGLHGTTGGTTTGGYNTRSAAAGGNVPEGTAGPHNSRIANAADPRVDSDLDGGRNRNVGGNSAGLHGTTGTTHGTTHGTTGLHDIAATTGPAPKTAGPHKSDLLNKVDPRVDSDLDGSKTTGGNKTFSQSTLQHKDPTDAAQVPPSVLQKHIGAPSLEHDNAQYDREKRHSISHQEKHRGL